ncbi:MAG: hypothetical protein M3Q69_05085 [Acidobacteriota bacterium]|nr:hypothetical protein [Acidobacteriota bacterium]
MTPLSAWPALQAGGRPLPSVLHYERAVFGKVHGAPSDFRWIARTRRFAEGATDPQRELNIGGEDVPSTFQAWRCLGDRYFAVSVYPSRSVDAAGRRGFLEKQVLEWRRPPDVPAALGALVLLPHVAAMSDAIWWHRLGEENWSRPDAWLTLDDADHEAIELDEGAIAAAIDRGRDALRAAAGSQALTQFYAQIVNGRRPAFLSEVSAPLPPEALASLLLSLPRELADGISISGWVPSARPSLTDLATRWDVLVAPSRPSSAIVAQPSERAWAMAEDLLAAEPGLVSLAMIETAVEEFDVEEPEVLVPLPDDTYGRPDALLELAPPDDAAATILHDLYAFARAPQRRWLDVASLPRPGIATSSARQSAARVLLEWVGQVRAQRPPYAHEEQWGVKVDLLRSAALVLLPQPLTVQAIGLPDVRSHVPALLFGLLLNSRECDALSSLGEDALRDAVAQSLNCSGARRYEAKMWHWLREWRGATSRSNVRAILDEALRNQAA